MNVLGWIGYLIRTAAFFLEIKATFARYELQRKIEWDIEEAQSEIERLRSLGDPDSQRRADELFARVLRGQRIVASLPAPSAPAGAGEAGADEGRGSHPG